MIVTLTGENAYGLQAELQKLVGVFVKEHGDLALERLDGAEADIARIGEALTSLPFLATRKMVVLRTPSTNKQFTERAEQLLSEVPETTDVILVEPKLDKRLSYYKLLKKSTDFRAFPELDMHNLARYLVDAAKANGGTLSLSDAQYLIERVGASQQILSSELEKLLLFNPVITRSSINELTEATPQSTIFELLEAAFAGNAKKTMDLYREQRALKVEPPQIIAMLAWQLHVLAILKAAGDRSIDTIAKEAKMSPFVLRKRQGIARKLTTAQLKRLTHDLLDIDLRSKRTSIETDDALQHYLLKLAQ